MATQEPLTVAQIPDDNIRDIGDYKANSLWRLTIRRFFRQRSAIVGAFILGILVFTAVFAPVLAPHDPAQDFIGEENVKRRDPPVFTLWVVRKKDHSSYWG